MLAPILEKMVSFFQALIGMVDVFLKKLGFAGVNFKNINKSIKSSAKATKQLISGFDELNVYNSGSSNSSGYLIDPTSDFNPIDYGDVEEKMKQFGEKIKEILQKIFDSLASIKWFDLGQTVWDWISAVDWTGIIENLSQLLGGLVGAAGAFIVGFFKDSWEAAVEWWHKNAIKDGKFTMEGFLEGILEAIKDIGKWIKDHIFTPFINGFKSLFKIGSPSKVMYDLGVDIVLGLYNGLSNMWTRLKVICTESYQ